MSRFIAINGMEMERSTYFNWRVDIPDYLYHPKCEVYGVFVGPFMSGYDITYDPDDNLVSFNNENETFHFSVGSLKEASELAYKFVKGMNLIDQIPGTVYEGTILKKKRYFNNFLKNIKIVCG